MKRNSLATGKQFLRSSPLVLWAILVGLLAFGIVSWVYSLTIGAVSFDYAAVWSAVFGTGNPDPSIANVVWQLRAPRGLLAMVAGAGLATAGVVMQTLVRNPLADPYLLGVSSGASVGATAVLTTSFLSSFGLVALTSGALLGAVLGSAIVYGVTILQGGLSPLRLVLSGVVLSSAFSAVASFLVFKAPDPRAAQSVMFWMLGSVAGAQWNKIYLPALFVVVSILVVLVLAPQLDALATGPDTAAALGVRVPALMKLLFVLQAGLVGVLVAVVGGIGFVGLVIPHLARLIVGSSHRRVVLVAPLLGAVFLLWVDIIARVAAVPQEIPLGVVTGIVGAPIFLMLMGRNTYQFGGER
ncbi:FecCD family ABC transporter permease [Corynebacterium epidermidicanis]|uniref:ABC-type Fe3+-siderophore transport system, permease component n=1 Tax=Corynebacterium epidermidicanis TaxID=1050174 RepID=A0A0G3GP55_9CORY|nr:iron ABC transporter permease [Corynebacterium epidermidicanis]AKK02934.1 ABC-type Fe3+-siderophore transport system, permease component [Corynebacterium epidermidicanis]